MNRRHFISALLAIRWERLNKDGTWTPIEPNLLASTHEPGRYRCLAPAPVAQPAPTTV